MALKELDATPELRDDPSLKDFNDIATLAKSFKETKAFVGTSIRPAGPDASPEAKKEFFDKLQKHAPHLVPLDDKDAAAQDIVWSRLGRPKDPNEYTFQAPEGVAIDIEGLRAVAVKTGMTKSQFQKAAETAVAAEVIKRDGALDDNRKLRTEWGAAYDQNAKAAASAAAKAGAPDTFIKAVADGKLPSDQMKMWHSIGKMLGGEGTEIGKQRGSGGVGASIPTPAEAKAQIDEIMDNPVYWDRAKRGTAEHKALVSRVAELEQYAAS